MQRRLAAILAADVVGYSRLAAADEEGTVSRLRALRHELIDPVVAAHGGRLVKTTGDGRIIEFASVVDAVRCAIEAQRKIAVRNADVAPHKRIEFRIGLHLGDVIVEGDGDLMGDGVNIAARLETIAEPGGICLSNAAYDQVRDKIAAEFTDLGDKELKNIARPVRVYSILPQNGSTPAQAGVHRAEVATSGGVAPDFRRGGEKREGAERSSLAGASPPRLSIVVLPFADIGGDPEQEYFVDGVTESLTTDLSRISGSFVIARNTAFTFDRNMAAAHGTIGHAKLFDGRAEETEPHILEALRLSPKDAVAWHWMFVAGMAKVSLARDEEAVAWLRRSVEIFRYFSEPHFFLAAALAHIGRVDEARAAAQAGLALDPGHTVSRIPFSDNPTYLARYERYRDGLRKAGVPEE